MHATNYLFLAPDNWVELLAQRGLGKVAADDVERRCHAIASGMFGCKRCVTLTEVAVRAELCTHALTADAKALQYASGDTFALGKQAEQQMLGADLGRGRLARL